MLPQDGIVEADENITMPLTARWNVEGAGKVILLSISSKILRKLMTIGSFVRQYVLSCGEDIENMSI